MQAAFLGIDLAWSARNVSGVAALQLHNGRATLTEMPIALRTDEHILAFVARHADRTPLLVAIDAPLCVPNQTGKRKGDALISKAFGKYGAGAHPANRTILGKYNGGVMRGEALIAGLAALDVQHTPHFPAQGSVRCAFEVYPHAAMIGLFGLARALRYKRKGGLSRAAQESAWRQYSDHLAALQDATPPLDLPTPLLQVAWSKAEEDKRDAVLCAYIALHCWWHGSAFWQVYGTLEEGYIVAPRLALSNGAR
jgi:predicted RNase H-like nuclease